jgi:hypothetical protein
VEGAQGGARRRRRGAARERADRRHLEPPHLVPERASENEEARITPDGELHPGETAEEKLSLSDRFGLLLPFFAFDQPTYLRIVDWHARDVGLAGRLSAEELHARALRIALERGSRSGRTARQACIAILQELPA